MVLPKCARPRSCLCADARRRWGQGRHLHRPRTWTSSCRDDGVEQTPRSRTLAGPLAGALGLLGFLSTSRSRAASRPRRRAVPAAGESGARGHRPRRRRLRVLASCRAHDVRLGPRAGDRGGRGDRARHRHRLGRRAARGTPSTIEFLRPIPSVALIPLAVLLYGTTLRSTLLLVVYAAFWQVLVQVLYGVADVDPVASTPRAATGFARGPRSGTWSGRPRCRTS